MARRDAANLTPTRIREDKPRARAWVLWDAKVRGFGVRVFPGGGKAYLLKFRTTAGKQKWFTIARVGEIGLDEARKRAGRALAEIRDGGDPAQQRQEQRQAPTVAEGLDRFFSEYAPKRVADGLLSERTVYEYRTQADSAIRPALGGIKIAHVTRADIERAFAKAPPVRRNRLLALTSRLFTYWQRIEFCEPGFNPAKLIERAREEPRDRVLAPSELQALGAALSELDSPIAGVALRFLMLTGWRNGEALALRWDDVNLETAEIVLASTKTGRDRRTVGAAALDIIASLPRIDGNPFVFAGSYGKAIAYKTLRLAFREACERAGITDARLHDIRRTMATSAAASGLTLTGLRDLLNHRTTTMAARYARRADSVLKQTQDEMADKMAALMSGEGGEVVPLKRPA